MSYLGNSRDVEIEVDSVRIDLYDYLDDWSDEAFDKYFEYSGRNIVPDVPLSLNSDGTLNYNMLAWEISRGNIDKAKLLKAIEGIN